MIRAVKIKVTPTQPVTKIIKHLTDSGCTLKVVNNFPPYSWVLVDDEGTIHLKECMDQWVMHHFPEYTLPTGHVHAKLIAAYAEIAQTDPEPHLKFQFQEEDGTWHQQPRSGSFYPDVTYRLKPQTRRIGDYDVPTFPDFKPIEGHRTARVSLTSTDGIISPKWRDSEHERFLLRSGIVYPWTEEGRGACQLHAKALLEVSAP